MRIRPLIQGTVLALAALAPALPAFAEEGGAAGLQLSGMPSLQELQAQQKACESRKPKRATQGISELTYKRMERILVAVGKGEYAESEQALAELTEKVRGDYEKAVVMQTQAYVYALQNKYAKAITAYEAALATEALPNEAHENMMFNVAQMYMSENRFDKGEQMLKKYMEAACNPVPEAHISLAMIYAERKQFRESLKQADLAIVKSKTPKETWLQLKLALHFELKEIPKCAEVLVHLIALSPMKETYFKQLHGVLTEIKRDQEALAVLALTERRGFLDEEKEYLNLSNMYMFMEIPLRAAQVLDRGLEAKQVEANEKNLEKLANAWFAAREYAKAEDAMGRAAKASDKGELWKQLGYIQLEREKYKDALDSFQRSEKKGGSKKPGEVEFMIGVTATQLKQWKLAENALRSAMTHEQYTKQATEWLNHMRNEQAYYAPAPEPAAEPKG